MVIGTDNELRVTSWPIAGPDIACEFFMKNCSSQHEMKPSHPCHPPAFLLCAGCGGAWKLQEVKPVAIFAERVLLNFQMPCPPFHSVDVKIALSQQVINRFPPDCLVGRLGLTCPTGSRAGLLQARKRKGRNCKVSPTSGDFGT